MSGTAAGNKDTLRTASADAGGRQRWSLRGMTALVTGGTRGIGRAVVEELAALGAAADLRARLAEWDAAAATNHRGTVRDVSIRDQRKRLLRDQPRVHVRRTSGSRRARLLRLRRRRRLHGLHLRGYAMAKDAMNQLAKNVACEWAKDGIRANAVAPWYIRTPLVQGDLSREEYAESILGRTPQRRVGEPEEISSPVAFLCMPCASYITGTDYLRRRRKIATYSEKRAAIIKRDNY
uniref:Uncharacterized protein n=1 Tax=Setaria viridis TaxID=4556 RepID=A0A4U6TFM9_SETVI|nr:hypothetical protein SEVIR_8G050300v2 [Setaria viridis]